MMLTRKTKDSILFHHKGRRLEPKKLFLILLLILLILPSCGYAETEKSYTEERYTRTAINWNEGICDFYNDNFIEILLAGSRIQDRQADGSNALSGFAGALVSQGKLITAVSQTDPVYSFALNEMDAAEELSYFPLFCTRRKKESVISIVSRAF